MTEPARLTLEMQLAARDAVRRHTVHNMDLIVRLHPKNLEQAFLLGLAPFAPLFDVDVIECQCPP